MGEGHSERVIRSLESGFEAALAREDDIAANDLALSLLQGRSLRDSLTRGESLSVIAAGGETLPVHLVGEDFVAGGASGLRVLPLERALLRSQAGARPHAIALSLVGFLRRGLRSGLCECELTLGDQALRGRLALVGSDHLAVETPTGRFFIPLQRLSQIWFPDGRLEDVF
ncbi:MAG: hypothetical protein ACRDKZ_07195 [Actinomycetota bacterium]